MTLLQGDCLTVLPTLAAGSVQTCITSPPYWGLRDYQMAGQIGLEGSVDAYVAALVVVFAAVRRVLRDDGTLWCVLGDSYSSPNKGGLWDVGRTRGKHSRATYTRQSNRGSGTGLGEKQLMLIPARVALALQADGWVLRSDIIWHKPSPMPESVLDRPTSAHEHIFLFAKQPRYYYNADAIRELHTDIRTCTGDRATPISAYPGRPQSYSTGGSGYEKHPNGRNKRNVWTVATSAQGEAHFAVFPPELIRPCLRAGSRPGDTVLDPFNGAGTTGVVALQEGRAYVGIDLNPAYLAMTERRLARTQPPLFVDVPA